jgi:hypothetical protein
MRRWLILAAGPLSACGGGSGGTEGDDTTSGVLRQHVIYGSDNRVEALDYPNLALAAETTELVGALLPRAYVTRDEDGWRLSGPSLKDQLPLCEGEPFGDQPKLAACTALLTRESTIMTAGHCLAPELASDYLFVRGYYLGDGFPRVAADRVHEIEAILSRIDGDLSSESSRDTAIARLRTTEPLPAADLSPGSDELKLGDPVIVAGTSEGLPLKIDGGGTVFAVRSPDYFEMTTDTFRGGSGSPVFASDGHVLGMLVGGAADYEWNEAGECYERLTFDSPVARGEIAVSTEALERTLTDALSDASPQRDAPRCSTATAGEHGASNWWACAAIVVTALGLARRAQSRRWDAIA